MNPSCCEFIYCDTDSIHLNCFFPVLADNVDSEFREKFTKQAYNYISGYKNSPIYGTLESEGLFPLIKYRVEKVYNKVKTLEDQEYYFKGMPARYIDSNVYDMSSVKTFLVNLQPGAGGGININSHFKKISFVPYKRFFREQHSIAFKYPIGNYEEHSYTCGHIKKN